MAVMNYCNSTMCLLFVYLNETPEVGQYKVILTNNRDEMLNRPTKSAHIWDNGILAGMDNRSGCAGGTWLGIANDGRIGCLLNILENMDEVVKNRERRGFLVVNYLLSEQSGKEYIEGISKSGVSYHPFNFITLDPKDDAYVLTLYDYQQDKINSTTFGVHGFGNCTQDKPFRKVTWGREKMQEIVNNYGTVEYEEQLVDELMNMMHSEQKHLPDLQIEAQGRGHTSEFLEKASSLCYVCRDPAYGTRTTTMILIDYNDRVLFVEKTMREPIDLDNIQWTTSTFTFNVEKQSVNSRDINQEKNKRSKL